MNKPKLVSEYYFRTPHMDAKDLEKYSNGTIKSSGRATICGVVTVDEPNVLKIGITRCNPNHDIFKKDIGRTKACARAIYKPEVTVDITGVPKDKLNKFFVEKVQTIPSIAITLLEVQHLND